DVQPDRPDVQEGMRATLGAAGKEPNATATVMWWAWGVHRAVDYLVTDKSIDPKRIASIGHSRLGKTALRSGAVDARISVGVPHQCGCGGAGPSRSKNKEAEGVKDINNSFPHWFCGNFKAFNADPSKLPFDQNCLIALCAPRPVMVTNAQGDQWANPDGQF